MNALSLLRIKEMVNASLVTLTRQRILIVEAQIYNFVINLCLPNARKYLQNHHSHSTSSDIICPCFTTSHSHKHWLIYLIFKIHTLLLASNPNGFTLIPQQYLPKLTAATPFIYQRRVRHLAPDDFQPAIDTLKLVLYQWLNIPVSRDAEYRCILVNQLYNHLGPASLLLPGVWTLCYKFPKWIFVDTPNTDGSQLNIAPLRLFSACIQALPAASPDSIDYKLLNELWDLFMQFMTAVRGGNRTRTNIQLYDGPEVELNPALAEARLMQFVEFLQTSLKATKNELHPSHKLYNQLTQPIHADFYMPLREFAPSRTNLRNQPTGPLSRLRDPIGFFNLLTFRLLCFNTEASRTLPFDFTIESLQGFREIHKDNKKYWHNSSAYGNQSPFWMTEGVMERLWNSAHTVWPIFLKTMTGIYSLYLGVIF